mmetsp:Transcript_114629/g.220879  ORF Transcript_114629/g.220879 Transcript_114629/m.220879 type:complete len:92 (+) Transcript_114629:2332-2607(+)
MAFAEELEDFVAAVNSTSPLCGASRIFAIGGSLNVWPSSSPLGEGQIMSSWKKMVPRHEAPDLTIGAITTKFKNHQCTFVHANCKNRTAQL